jgi:hypothetical protein
MSGTRGPRWQTGSELPRSIETRNKFPDCVAHGERDPCVWKVRRGQTDCDDLDATILRLIGIDHTRLTFRHNVVDRRLTDPHGHVINTIPT